MLRLTSLFGFKHCSTSLLLPFASWGMLLPLLATWSMSLPPSGLAVIKASISSSSCFVESFSPRLGLAIYVTPPSDSTNSFTPPSSCIADIAPPQVPPWASLPLITIVAVTLILCSASEVVPPSKHAKKTVPATGIAGGGTQTNSLGPPHRQGRRVRSHALRGRCVTSVSNCTSSAASRLDFWTELPISPYMSNVPEHEHVLPIISDYAPYSVTLGLLCQATVFFCQAFSMPWCLFCYSCSCS